MLLLTIALLCVVANGFFVAAEFAIAKVRPTSLEALAASGDLKAKLALSLVRRLDAYLTATQLGITLASLGLGWLGEPAIAGLMEPTLARFGFSPEAIHAIALTVAFSLITTLHIIVGELIPKSLAIQRPEQVARLTAAPLKVFYFVVFPALYVLNGISNLVLRWFGFSPSENMEGKLSLEELRLVVRASFAEQGIERTKRDILERVLRSLDLPARAVMVPRVDMITLALSDSIEGCLEKARAQGYSRYPVSPTGEPDQISGYLHVKDLILSEPGDLASRKRDVLFVPETRSVADLLAEFQRTAIPMAILVDEYGGTAGLVTIEDAVEVVVGDIRDEFDHPAPKFRKDSDGSIVVDGAVPVHELHLQEVDNVSEAGDTIGGRITSTLGRLPRVGDSVLLGPYEAVVEEVRRRRIRRVRLRPPPSASETDESSAKA